ncbi:hypothetical protein [Arthrobacter sp. ES1]|uniref:hypothetical protein n=1 Tax=Arthrobacter sp. ES1 TaxID=1897056 RepID=UPI001CFFA644|nr:hypothetical protein [Arthrobacter sp. ES1]
MGRLLPLVRRPAGENHRIPVCRRAAAMVCLALTASCSAGATRPVGPVNAPPTSAAALPITVEINQLRDNYSRQIIAVQLTNNTDGPVTVLSAGVASPLFSGTIPWQAAPGGIEIPPGQTKILPAQLRAPDCGIRTLPPGAGPDVSLGLAVAGGAVHTSTVTAGDPYGVMDRNNAEMCLAQAAGAVADLRLETELEVSADAKSAVLRLDVTPRSVPGAVNPGSLGSLTIDRIDGTTLLDEDPSHPWPRSVSISAGGAGQQFRLVIRPARCDPHAVAEDKVGTLLPLRVSSGGREGVLKVDAGALLRGRIYDFITAACGRK